MTDEELKKALHWCGEDTCSGCPLENIILQDVGYILPLRHTEGFRC